jgi:hypothetical protein
LVDVQAGIIVDVEATPTLRTAEVNATRTMIDRVEERFDLKPERLIGDMAYGSAELLGWMVNEKGIEPHVPLWDRTQRDDETLSSSDFRWDEQADEYRCPRGNALRKQRRTFKNMRTHITKAGTIIYRASQSDCAQCPMKARCCPNTPNRDERMAESTDGVALSGAGSPNGDDIDGLGQEAAVAQALDLHSRGWSKSVEVERTEVLAGQQTRIAPQALDPSRRLGRPLGASQFEQERLVAEPLFGGAQGGVFDRARHRAQVEPTQQHQQLLARASHAGLPR